MYYSKIEAVAPAELRIEAPVATRPKAGHAVLGLALLIVALPFMAMRVFAWAVARDLRRIGKLAGIVGQSFADAARK